LIGLGPLQTVAPFAHNAVMAKLERDELSAALGNSQSGGGVRLEGTRSLKDFADFARAHNAVVCGVETYELRGQHEVPRIDLSIYQGGAEERALPAAERVHRTGDSLSEVLAAIDAEGIACVFQVWADQLMDAS
jgi:hypothetical protein